MAANTMTSTTGTVYGVDPDFVLAQRTNNDQGLVFMANYTKGTEANLTFTFDAYNPSLSPTIMITGAAVAAGSTTSKLAHGAFMYSINKGVFHVAANAVGVTLAAQTVPQNKYGAVALDVGTDGTVHPVPAGTNTTGYNSAALAYAGLPAVDTNHIRIGYVTVIETAVAGFVIGTDALATAGTATVAFTSTASGTYRMTSLSGTLLTAYTMVIMTSGRYRVPLSIIGSEKIICVNATYSSSAQGGALVANLMEG